MVFSHGLRRLVFAEATSGVLTSCRWRRVLLAGRAMVTTFPITKAIAISKFVKRQLTKLGVPDHKLLVVYNGVNTNRFAPSHDARQRLARSLEIANEEIIISTASRLTSLKHPEVIIDACGLLIKEGLPIRLLVAGEGELQTALEEQVRNIGIVERVCFLGSVANLEGILQASDIFVLASVGEAFGYVIAEAMACGVPVVGSRSGAIEEIVEHGKTGLLAEPLDSASFAASMRSLAVDKSLRERMGAAGLVRARLQFTVEETVKETVRICMS